MEQIHLSARLQAIADLIPEGSSVVDVGTDHGYLPIWLAQRGRCKKLAASDVHRGPLEHAKRSAKEFDLEERIEFALCSGLQFKNSREYDTVVIAGMGGETIQMILEQDPWALEKCTLILQPNSKIETLQEWLREQNCGIQMARLVKDSGRIYQILVVSGHGGVVKHTPGQDLVDPLYFQQREPLLPEYLKVLIEKYQRSVDGLRQGQVSDGRLELTEQLLEELRAMEKETETWQL